MKQIPRNPTIAKSSHPTEDADLILVPDLTDFPPKPSRFTRLITVTED